MGRCVGDAPVASQHALLTAQNSGMASDQEGAPLSSAALGWDAYRSLSSLSWPGRAVLAMAGAEKGKKHGPSPCRISCPTRCPWSSCPAGGALDSFSCEGQITGPPLQHGCRGQPLRQRLLALNCSPDPCRAALGRSSEQDRKLPAFVELTFQKG